MILRDVEARRRKAMEVCLDRLMCSVSVVLAVVFHFRLVLC
jgi:hypothetical protein